MKDNNKQNNENSAFDMKIRNVQMRKNYGGIYKDSDIVLPCYTKKQMRSLYPDGQFKAEAEYAPGSRRDRIEALRHEKAELPLTEYGANSRIIYCEKGFAAVDSSEDSYAVLLKNVLLPRIAALVLCLAVIVCAIVLFALPDDESEDVIADTANTPGAPELEEGAVDWEGVKTTEESGIPADGIRIPGYKSITIEADTAEVSVNLQNPEKNNCYFVIRLVLLDTGETLYESKMIEPGKGLYDITLSHAMEAGTYNAQLQYEPYDMTAMTRLNGAVVNLELIVE